MAMTDDDQDRRRRQRLKNWALLGVLMTFVVVVYFVSIIRMGGG
jgi:hypothetical protein